MLNDCPELYRSIQQAKEGLLQRHQYSFHGTPCYIIGTKAFDCRHGPDQKKAFKSKQENVKIRSVIVMLSTVEVKYLKQALHFVIQVYKAYNVTLSL